MTTSNIQKFDEITGLVFGALYEQFPVPRDLLIGDFVEDGFDFSEAISGYVANPNGRFFIASVEWLAKAGYVHYENQLDDSGFDGVVLTVKGLEALKAVPASITAGSSLGDQLIDATKTGTKSVLGSLAGEVLSVGSRLVTAHFGLPG